MCFKSIFWVTLAKYKRVMEAYKKRVFNPFRPEFTIVIFIHYKSRIAIAILDL